MISFGAVKLKLYKIEKLPHVCPLSNTHGENSATPSFCKLIESSCEWSSQNLISIRLSSSLKKSFYSIYLKAPLLWSTKIPPQKKTKKNHDFKAPTMDWVGATSFLEFYQETSLAACCTSTICGRRLISWKGPKLYTILNTLSVCLSQHLYIHRVLTKYGIDTCVHTLWWSKETLARYNLGITTWLFHHGSFWIQYSCKLMFGIFYGQQVLLVQNIWKSMAQLSHCIGLRMPELWRTSAFSSTTSKLSWTY